MEQGIVIKNKPKNGDVLYYENNGYKNISFKQLLNEVNKNILDLEKRLLEAEKTIKEQQSEIKLLKGED